jgi:hypothetical protein
MCTLSIKTKRHRKGRCPHCKLEKAVIQGTSLPDSCEVTNSHQLQSGVAIRNQMPECISINPLQRSGTSQYKRVLQALLPAYAQVDERDYADLILFAKQYASYLTYFDAANKANGDWLPLMKMDVSVSLATIARQDAAAWFTYIQELYKQVQDTNNLALLQQHYTSIFNFITTLIYQLDEQLQSLPTETGFREYLEITIASRLGESWSKLRTYYEESGKAVNGMINNAAPLSPPETPIQVRRAADLLINNLSAAWTTVAFIPPINGADAAEKIKHTINHNIFKGLVEGLLKAYSAVISTAGKYLQETLNDFPSHTPHYALYLTFIKLFKVAQDHLNQFTDRHLKFYYKDILRLKSRPAQPDQVHLVFELQKNVEQHLLKRDTLFKAGKNKTGQELFYALTDDIVVNKGKVKSIRSVLAVKDPADTYATIYTAPVSNSADGKGADLVTADKSWKPFGDAAKNDTAVVGFAIAHPLLLLKEGTRTVNLSIHFNNNSLDTVGIVNELTLKYSAVKGWQELKATLAGVFGTTLNIIFTIPAEDPAWVPYDEKIHKAGFATRLPLLQLLLKNEAGTPNKLKTLTGASVNSIGINVSVSDIKNVTIQNEIGPLDVAKPFALFGPKPHFGSAFTIGSHEIFLKNNQHAVTATLNIEWDHVDRLEGNKYNDGATVTNKNVRVNYLQDGQWKTTATPAQILLKHLDPTIDGVWYHANLKDSVTIQLPAFSTPHSFEADRPYSINEQNGYVQVEFRGPTDFGHSDYIKRFTKASLTTPNSLPDEPYTPTVKSMSLSYSANADMDLTDASTAGFTESNGFFYHMTPFGHAVQHRSILGATAYMTLVPVFSNEGEIYIGIEGFKASQSLHLLFRVSDGSADPAYNRQPLQWSFLTANNQWTSFDQYSVTDQTNDLTKTGIIRFAFPSTATAVNTLMTEQLFWIRATAAENTPAVCNLVNIHAQAATAILYDHYQVGLAYTDLLPAGTIAKLLISDSALKSTVQPYDSFNGRIKEPDAKFYTRISERLRHKNRAITMWDYERLVLQQFPDIYKVKCINHTKINTAGKGDNELLPGYVLVVPIPDLTGKNAINPLRPQTSIGTLEEIKQYLRTIISPFVKLEVKNARFEEIQLDFKVKFLTDDGAYYANLLISEIEQYLSPWAFGGSQEIEFGGKISKSKLLDFIEERSYVDYLTCFKMYHIVNGIKSGDVEEAVATSSRSVFVSYAGDVDLNIPKHLIDYVNPDCNC